MANLFILFLSKQETDTDQFFFKVFFSQTNTHWGVWTWFKIQYYTYIYEYFKTIFKNLFFFSYKKDITLEEMERC